MLFGKGDAMTYRSSFIRTRRFLRQSRLAQIALLMLFWLVGDRVVHLTGLPIPGGIVGMLLVLAMLFANRLSLPGMRRGANWFLAEMLLFFTPAVPSVLDHPELVGWLGFKILAVIVLSTIMVMVVTALTVDWCYRWRRAS